MKIKDFARVYGALRTGAFGFATYIVTNPLINSDYEKVSELVNGDSPLLLKFGVGAFLGTMAILTPLTATMTADGTYDMITGNQYGLILRGLNKITKNPKRKEKIQKSLDNMLAIVEKNPKI